MLGPEAYEAIGRLTVAFNDVDYMMTVCIIGLEEDDTDQMPEISEERDPGFGKKGGALKKKLNAVEKEFPALRPHIEKLRELVGEAKLLSDKRNEHAHGLVFRDFHSKAIRTRYRGVPKPIEIDGISAAAADASALFHKLIDAFSHLAEELRKARQNRDLRAAGLIDE